jgi:hypothetical protein
MSYDVLCTVNQVKQWMKVTTSADDGALGGLIMPASEMIGRFCNRDNLGGIYSYTENYSKRSRYTLNDRDSLDLVLRHWPIVSITSLYVNQTPLAPLTAQQIQAWTPGYYIEEDVEPRTVKIIGYPTAFPVQITYTAGYAQGSIPWGLQQACVQTVAEMFRAEQWVGKKSVNIGGEVVTGDMGDSWGLSARTRALLQPFRDINPFQFR